MWPTNTKDQLVHSPIMARVLGYPSLDREEAIEGKCNQGSVWLDCLNVKADQNLRWSHGSFRFSYALAHLILQSNCLHLRQFAWTVDFCFLGKIKKKSISICCLLKIVPSLFSVNILTDLLSHGPFKCNVYWMGCLHTFSVHICPESTKLCTW